MDAKEAKKSIATAKEDCARIIKVVKDLLKKDHDLFEIWPLFGRDLAEKLLTEAGGEEISWRETSGWDGWVTLWAVPGVKNFRIPKKLEGIIEKVH